MLKQQDDLDKDRYIVLVLSKGDLESYVSKKEAKSLFYNERFREYFENYIMQDWDLSLQTAIEDMQE